MGLEQDKKKSDKLFSHFKGEIQDWSVLRHLLIKHLCSVDIVENSKNCAGSRESHPILLKVWVLSSIFSCSL